MQALLDSFIQEINKIDDAGELRRLLIALKKEQIELADRESERLRAQAETALLYQQLLDEAHITANKNSIPFDTLSVKETSGMRFGSPASTTRGMKEAEMDRIGRMIARLIREGEDAVPAVKEEVIALCRQFPLYPEL